MRLSVHIVWLSAADYDHGSCDDYTYFLVRPRSFGDSRQDAKASEIAVAHGVTGAQDIAAVGTVRTVDECSWAKSQFDFEARCLGPASATRQTLHFRSIPIAGDISEDTIVFTAQRSGECSGRQSVLGEDER